MALAIAVAPIAALAQDEGEAAKASLISRTLEHEAPLAGFADEVYANPANQTFRFEHSLNVLSAGYDYRHATQPQLLEQGSGHSRGFGRIDAYLHKGKATLWGRAYYGNGEVRNVKYSETSDFMSVYPYVMADTVGGRNQQERYHFMGGFAYPLGRRWTIGAEGEYTALMEYRTVDPRPKNLTGDLRAKIGVAYRLNTRYWLGVAATARKYKQTNEVKLYNEVSVPNIYHLTGLGTDYFRFQGVNTSTYYKGYSFGGTVTLAPADRHGVFAKAELMQTHIDKIISTLNELPLTSLLRRHYGAAVGYTGGSGDHTFGAKIYAQGASRRGTENIFGTAQDNIYPQISALDQYSEDALSTGLQLLYQHRRAKSSYGFTLDGGYNSYKERYAEPLRRLKASALCSSLKAQGSVATGRWLLHGMLGGTYSWAGDGTITVSEADRQSTLFTPVAHKYGLMTNNSYCIDAALEANWLCAGVVMPFIRADWQYAHYLQHQHQQVLGVAAGVKF